MVEIRTEVVSVLHIDEHTGRVIQSIVVLSRTITYSLVVLGAT